MAVSKDILEQKKLTEQLFALQGKLQKVSEKIAKLNEKELQGTKQHTELILKKLKLQQDEATLQTSLLDKGSKIEDIEKTIAEYQKQKVKSQEESLAFENQILNVINKNVDSVLKLKTNQQDLFNLGDMQKELLNDISIMTGVNNDLVAQSKVEYNSVVDANKELLGLIDQTLASVKEVGKETFSATNFSGIVDTLNTLGSTVSPQNTTLIQAINNSKQLATQYQNLANQLNNVNQTAIGYRQSVASIGTAYQQTINGMNNFIKKNLPGGNLIASLFNFNTLGRDFKQNLTRNFNSILMNKITSNPTQAPGFASTLMSALGQTSRQLIARLAPFAGALFGAIVLYFMNTFDKLISKIVKDMGITRSEAAGLVRDTQGLASELGASSIYAEQLVESANKIREGLGGIDIASRIRSGNLIAKELVKTGAVLSDKFDLSGEEIGGLAITGVMFNKSLTQTTNITANMAKGVRSVKDALKDMASIPARISAGFAGTIAQLATMVNKAKLLGTSVESIRNMSESLLDIETSVAKQFEAQVLTGRQMDFDRARYFALMGRDDLAFEETLNQVGSLKEFKGFTPIAQKTIAEAAGFDVEEMSRILGRQELIQKLGISKQEFDSMLERGENIASLIERRKQEGLVSEDDYNELRRLSEEYDSTTIIEKLKRMAITLGNALSLLFEPLVDFLRDFMSRGGDGLIRGLGEGLAMIAKAILGISQLMGNLGGGIMLGAIAGAVIGSMVGGPMGALIGAGIGATIGAAGGIYNNATAPSGYGDLNAVSPGNSTVIDDQTAAYRMQAQQSPETNQYFASMAASLQSIDQQTRTPGVIQIGEKSISEIGTELTLKKNYTLGLDNTYNTTMTSNYRA
jgi:hypothetical protein